MGARVGNRPFSFFARGIAYLLWISSVLLVLGGCGATQPQVQQVPQAAPRYIAAPGNPNFVYTVPETSKSPKFDVVIAIVRPRLLREADIAKLGQSSSTTDSDFQARIQRGIAQRQREIAAIDSQMRVKGSTIGGLIVYGATGEFDAYQQRKALLQRQIQNLRFQSEMSREQAQKDREVGDRVTDIVNKFLDSARVDLERLFIGKGLRTMGPYRAEGDMTFSEKKSATFALAPTIELSLDMSIYQPEGRGTPGGGVFRAGGEFALVVLEPLSGQKLWSKRISITRKTAGFVIEKTGNDLTDNRLEVSATLLSAIYKELMETISKHSDPEEFLVLKQQATELKARATPGMSR